MTIDLAVKKQVETKNQPVLIEDLIGNSISYYNKLISQINQLDFSKPVLEALLKTEYNNKLPFNRRLIPTELCDIVEMPPPSGEIFICRPDYRYRRTQDIAGNSENKIHTSDPMFIKLIETINSAEIINRKIDYNIIINLVSEFYNIISKICILNISDKPVNMYYYNTKNNVVKTTPIETRLRALPTSIHSESFKEIYVKDFLNNILDMIVNEIINCKMREQNMHFSSNIEHFLSDCWRYVAGKQFNYCLVNTDMFPKFKHVSNVFGLSIIHTTKLRSEIVFGRNSKNTGHFLYNVSNLLIFSNYVSPITFSPICGAKTRDAIYNIDNAKDNLLKLVVRG